MTPKEKAEELVGKFYFLVQTKEEQKRCALMAVDEILKNFEGLHKPEYCAFDAIGERKFTFQGEYDEYLTGYDIIEYWQEVKQEIEKL